MSTSSSSSSTTANTAEIQDRLDVLFQQETTFYLTSDYLSALTSQQQQQHKAVDENGSTSTSNSKMLNQHWREVMCEWAYHVVDHFDFPRDIVSACMSFLDRYLANHVAKHPEGIPKHAFQLLAMTCLYIAVKLDQPRMLSLETMAHLSRGTFSKTQMQAMEMEILTNLQWHVHPPTPYTFLSYFIQLSKPNPAASKIYEMARYFVELSVLDYYFVGKPSSTVALAALMNAFEDQGAYDDLSGFVAPGQEELVRDCQVRLRSLYNVPDQSVFDNSTGSMEQAQQQPIYGRTSSPTCVSQNLM